MEKAQFTDRTWLSEQRCRVITKMFQDLAPSPFVPDRIGQSQVKTIFFQDKWVAPPGKKAFLGRSQSFGPPPLHFGQGWLFPKIGKGIEAILGKFGNSLLSSRDQSYEVANFTDIERLKFKWATRLGKIDGMLHQLL